MKPKMRTPELLFPRVPEAVGRANLEQLERDPSITRAFERAAKTATCAGCGRVGRTKACGTPEGEVPLCLPCSLRFMEAVLNAYDQGATAEDAESHAWAELRR